MIFRSKIWALPISRPHIEGRHCSWPERPTCRATTFAVRPQVACCSRSQPFISAIDPKRWMASAWCCRKTCFSNVIFWNLLSSNQFVDAPTILLIRFQVLWFSSSKKTTSPHNPTLPRNPGFEIWIDHETLEPKTGSWYQGATLTLTLAAIRKGHTAMRTSP